MIFRPLFFCIVVMFIYGGLDAFQAIYLFHQVIHPYFLKKQSMHVCHLLRMFNFLTLLLDFPSLIVFSKQNFQTATILFYACSS